ncbi:Methylthioadenosine phosphorylase [Gautieria morchelliformis]|nr:Methylthioadenosine phosphorylase [Gautieria morchelliformis]
MSELPSVLIGVIGGSGLYELDNLTPVTQVNPETPWGHPSSPITIARLPSGVHLAFVARHGTGHTYGPSSIPVRANIAALKALGVKAIVAFSAVGSLREEIRPGDFVLPDQIIDRTKGVRPCTFFDDAAGVVAHATFGDPFSRKLVEFLAPRVKAALDGRGVGLHLGKTVVCMEGPQFSTRAESRMYRAWGGDIINMSVLPEAKLAREAELGYALIATSTDYDAWRVGEEAVTAAEVFKTLKTNADTARHVTSEILEELHAVVETGDILSEEEGSMKYSIMRDPALVPEEGRRRLAYILPSYFS